MISCNCKRSILFKKMLLKKLYHRFLIKQKMHDKMTKHQLFPVFNFTFWGFQFFKKLLKMTNCIRTPCSSSRIWERGKKWMSINMVLLLQTAFNLFIVEKYVSQCIIKPIQNDCFLWSMSLNEEFWLPSEKTT